MKREIHKPYLLAVLLASEQVNHALDDLKIINKKPVVFNTFVG